MARDEDGYVESFDVALGGDAGRGRLARWAAIEVPAPRVFAGATALLEAYAAEAGAEESLGAYLARQPARRLSAFFQDDIGANGAGAYQALARQGA
ncbi:MAG: hypothetical protein U0531_07385 [Dehalococcoidia bacterium]